MGSSRRVSAGHGTSIIVLYRGRLYSYDMSQYTIHYKSNNNVVYSCKYHVVWCPKYRRSVLINGVDTRLKAIIQDVCTESLPSCSSWKSCQITFISWWKSIHSTAFIAWCVRSRGVPLGSYVRNIPGSSPACPPSGRTPTLCLPLVVRLWKSSSNTSNIRSGCKMIQRQLKLRLKLRKKINSRPGCFT